MILLVGFCTFNEEYVTMVASKIEYVFLVCNLAFMVFVDINYFTSFTIPVTACIYFFPLIILIIGFKTQFTLKN
jgi:hypothetical protein